MLAFETLTGNDQDLDRFTATLNIIRRRHLDTVPLMAQAVRKLNMQSTSQGVTDMIQYFLDRLYINRISIHMLLSHYHALLGDNNCITGMIGTIDPKCDLLAVCNEAYKSASGICDMEYFGHPTLKATAMDTLDLNPTTQKVINTTLVPSHLHHILFEIFKVGPTTTKLTKLKIFYIELDESNL